MVMEYLWPTLKMQANSTNHTIVNTAEDTTTTTTNGSQVAANNNSNMVVQHFGKHPGKMDRMLGTDDDYDMVDTTMISCTAVKDPSVDVESAMGKAIRFSSSSSTPKNNNNNNGAAPSTSVAAQAPVGPIGAGGGNNKKRKQKRGGASMDGKQKRQYPVHFRTTKKQRRTYWKKEEIEAMLKGVEKYGRGNWLQIKNDPELGETLASRTTVDIKDKWRNHMKHVEGGTVPGSRARKMDSWNDEESFRSSTPSPILPTKRSPRLMKLPRTNFSEYIQDDEEEEEEYHRKSRNSRTTTPRGNKHDKDEDYCDDGDEQLQRQNNSPENETPKKEKEPPLIPPIKFEEPLAYDIYQQQPVQQYQMHQLQHHHHHHQQQQPQEPIMLHHQHHQHVDSSGGHHHHQQQHHQHSIPQQQQQQQQHQILHQPIHHHQQQQQPQNFLYHAYGQDDHHQHHRMEEGLWDPNNHHNQLLLPTDGSIVIQFERIGEVATIFDNHPVYTQSDANIGTLKAKLLQAYYPGCRHCDIYLESNPTSLTIPLRDDETVMNLGLVSDSVLYFAL